MATQEWRKQQHESGWQYRSTIEAREFVLFWRVRPIEARRVRRSRDHKVVAIQEGAKNSSRSQIGASTIEAREFVLFWRVRPIEARRVVLFWRVRSIEARRVGAVDATKLCWWQGLRNQTNRERERESERGARRLERG